MKKLISLVSGLVIVAPFLASANMMGYGDDVYGRGHGMMGGYYGGVGLFFGVALHIVWLVISILVAVWLWRQINKK